MALRQGRNESRGQASHPQPPGGQTDVNPDHERVIGDSVSLSATTGSAAVAWRGTIGTKGKETEGTTDFQPQDATGGTEDDGHPYLIPRSQNGSVVLFAHRNGVTERRHQLWAKVITTAPKGSRKTTKFSIHLYQNSGDHPAAQRAAFVEYADRRDDIHRIEFSWLTPYFKDIAKLKGFSETDKKTASEWKDLSLYSIIAVLSCINPELKSDLYNVHQAQHKARVDWSTYTNEKTGEPKYLQGPGNIELPMEATDIGNVVNSIEHTSHLGGVLGPRNDVRCDPREAKKMAASHEDDDDSSDDSTRTVRPYSSSTCDKAVLSFRDPIKTLASIPIGSHSTTNSVSEPAEAIDPAKAKQFMLNLFRQHVEQVELKVDDARRQKTEVEEELRRKKEEAEEELKRAESWVEQSRRKNLKVAQEARCQTQEVDRQLRSAETELKEARKNDNVLKRSYGDMLSG